MYPAPLLVEVQTWQVTKSQSRTCGSRDAATSGEDDVVDDGIFVDSNELHVSGTMVSGGVLVLSQPERLALLNFLEVRSESEAVI